MLTQTRMEQEVRETPAVIEAQLSRNEEKWLKVIQRLQSQPVPFALTIARGSSDHAATFLKYLLEVKLGIPTVSAAPSVLTIYQRELNLKGGLVIGISQSGQSPDLLEMMQAGRRSGALTLAIVNQENSPLAELAEYVIPIHAGPETAVAASKSYLGSLTAFLHFLAMYEKHSLKLSGPDRMSEALKDLPRLMEETFAADWTALAQSWFEISRDHDQSGIILGRGFGYPIAQETALKLKETSALHAEAFSSAEFLHGPLGLIKAFFPVLLYLQSDQTLKGSLMTAKKIKEAGGSVFVISPKDLVQPEETCYTQMFCVPKTRHPLLDSLLGIAGFYPMAAKLAVLRGMNPDQPKFLKKITETR